MPHVLMVGPGTYSHLRPHVPVIAELVERGHRVTWTVPARFADLVASAGATPLLHTSVLPDPDRGETWPTDPVEGSARFLDEAVHVLPQVEGPLEADRPDAVLYDIGGHVGHALACRWGLPLVQLSPAVVAWDGFEDDMAEELSFRRTPEYARYLQRFARWLAEQGIDEDVETFVGSPPRCAVLIPRALQPHADRVDPRRCTFVGPALDRSQDEREWPEPRRPLVLVSLGSAYHDRPAFWRDCVAAFGPLPWEVVLAVGPHVDPAALGAVPDNVAVHRWVPQPAVLARASAFVTHAGMGSCSEGLHHGVPMVAVPQAVDQFGNAALLEQLGVARHLPAEQATPEALRSAVLEVSGSATVRERLAEASAELRGAGGASGAADLVEDEVARVR